MNNKEIRSNNGRFLKGHTPHNKGITLEEEFGIEQARRLREKFSKINKTIFHKKRKSMVWSQWKDIIHMYMDDGKSAIEISKNFDCGYSTIYAILRANNIIPKRNKKIWNQKQNIVEMYAKGLSIPEISKIINCNYSTVYSILKKENILLRPPGFYMKGKTPYNKLNLNEKEIIELYQQKSIVQIANEFNCSYIPIYDILKKNKISIKGSRFFNAGEHSSPQTEFKPGEKHPFFNNWSSFDPYTLDFNDFFKEKIKERDSYTCLVCNLFEEDARNLYKQGLMIHHIDYNKKNSFPQNCISLCAKCHAVTNYNRDHWKIFFQSLLKEKYDYKYTVDQKIILDFVDQKLTE